MNTRLSRMMVFALLLLVGACSTKESGAPDVAASLDVGADVSTSQDVSTGPVAWVPPAHEASNPVTMDVSAIPVDDELFPAGVLSGDPTPDSMLLWGHATDNDGLRLKLWLADIDPAQPQLVDLLLDEAVTLEEGGFVHRRVDSVVPGRLHAFALFKEPTAGAPVARSRVSTFRAAPPEGALVKLTVSGTHGTRETFEPYPALTANAEFEPYELYFHLGDAIYADDMKTIDEFRGMWVNNWAQEGFAATLSKAPYLPIWDDHEVGNDYDPETMDPERIEIGQQAYYEANPVEYYPDEHYRSWTWGDTLEVFALDSRSERKPSTRETPDAQYLSPEQFEWFKASLLSSTATFKLVLNSVPVIDFPGLWDIKRDDRWEAYESARNELIAFLNESQVPNVYFVTGDFHMATVGRFDPPGGPGYEHWEFFMGPGAQSNPLGNRQYVVDTLGEENDPLKPDQFPWGYPTPTMTYVDFDPFVEPPTMTLRYYDPDGTPLYRAVFADQELVESNVY